MSAETTAAATTGNLSLARTELGAAANPSSAAYYAGGRTLTSAVTAVTDKLTFSNDTTAAVTTANLSLGRRLAAGLSERSTKAYFGGGDFDNGIYSAVTDKLTFSNDTTAAVTTANLSQARSGQAGMSQGSTKGYWDGGGTTSPTVAVKTADKITFSTDTTSAQTTANLSVARFNESSGSDGSTQGYWCGGITGTAVQTTVDKITFSTDTTAAFTTSSFLQEAAACASDGNKMLALGGFTNGTGLAIAGGNKITFSSGAVAALGGSCALSVARGFPAGASTVAL